MFANNIVRAILSVCSLVAIGQVVAGYTLVSRDFDALENHQREAWKSTHVYLAGLQTSRLTDRTVVLELEVRKLRIPVVLSSIDDHTQQFSRSVVHPLHVSVTVWMMGACASLRPFNSCLTAVKAWNTSAGTLCENMARGHPCRGMYWLTRILTVTSAVNLGRNDGKHIGPTT